MPPDLVTLLAIAECPALLAAGWGKIQVLCEPQVALKPPKSPPQAPQSLPKAPNQARLRLVLAADKPARAAF